MAWHRWRLVLPTAILASLGILMATRRDPEGCSAYVPAEGPLVAHAGGGLPDRLYANDLEALDLAARHGFTLIELDFMERNGRLTIGHDGMPESSLSILELMKWLDLHPRIAIITDVKTNKINGLKQLADIAGFRQARFIPQIYSPSEYAPVIALGYSAPILTVYRIGDDGWQAEANALPLRAITIPVDRSYFAKGIKHPVFLHTVNHPIANYGLYTDCLVPR